MKMKKNKKKKEPVVINQEPLSITVIGQLETKENGPIFAIVGVAIFVICIVCLPYLSEWITSLSSPEPPIVVDGNDKPISPPSDSDEPVTETEYYSLTPDLSIVLDKVTFNNFVLDSANNTITLQAVVTESSSNFFANNKYYLELYTNDELLLDRIRLLPTSTGTVYSFSRTLKNINPSSIAKVAITLKDEADYPNVDLTEIEEVPTLTCTKDSETIYYRFTLEEEEYLLKETEEVTSYENTNSQYETILTEYTILAETYEDISGVSVRLTPLTTGFSFQTNIDLEEISTEQFRKNFTKDIYYPLDTSAKVVAFEVSALGYDCK